jgi:antagonist of KipI
VLLGPHDDRFPPEAIEQLLSTAYTVAPDSDRMGYRLAGPRLARREPADLVSGGMSLGGIQVPGDGQPIILLSDHQTTGGYPLLATVIQADLPLVAQLAPGQSLRFQAVSLEAARAAYLAMLASLETSGR